MFDFADSFWNVGSPGFSDWFLSLSRDVNKLGLEVKTWMVSFCDRREERERREREKREGRERKSREEKEKR